MAIIVTNTGQVENRTVSIPAGISVSDMEKMVNLLNHKLTGVPIYKLKSAIYSEVGQEMQRYVGHFEEMMNMLDEVLSGDTDGQRLFLSGATNMLNQPEFRNVDKVKSILDLLEETPTLTKMLSSSSKGSGIQVRIGSENDHEAFADCSLITATYAIDGEAVGTIGILGPTRMEYARVIKILDILSKDMTTFLSKHRS